MAVRVIAMELHGASHAVWRDGDRWFVVDTHTDKAIECLCPEQAFDLFDRCCDRYLSTYLVN